MLFKQIKIEFDAKWVLTQKGTGKLPIDVFVDYCKKTFVNIEITDSTLKQCTAVIKNTEISINEINDKISALLNEKYKITIPSEIVKIEIIDIEFTEKENNTSEETKTADDVAASDKVEKSDVPLNESEDNTKVTEVSIDEKIESLVGAEEFKALAKEIKIISKGINAHKTYEVFSFQNYLFSINDGCGLSTYLQLFAELTEKYKLFEFARDDRIVEVRLLPPGDGKDNPFEPLTEHFGKYNKNKGKLFSIDISEWMTKITDKKFREFLFMIEKYSENNIFVFRIPFVEREVLDNITVCLQDMLFIRAISFTPMNIEQLTMCAKRALEKYKYSADDDVWEVFRTRINEEKSDGRFYGINTVNKVIREMVYRKLLSDSLKDADEKEIKKDDIISLSKTLSGENTTNEATIDNMVGMEKIRANVDEIIAQIELAKKNKIGTPCIHMRFVGSPGTGKTTVAREIGRILKERGVLRNGNFFEYSGRDFCGRYVGETAPKTASMCRDAYGSVLFIDEAYTLYRGDGAKYDYGREALDTLIAEMENHRDDLVVIMAGYTEEMEELMKGNAGLESRMPYIIEFPNYTREQLTEIFFKMIGDKFKYDEAFAEAIKEYFGSLKDEVLAGKTFSNARFVRNLFERTCAKASMRRAFDEEGKLELTKEDFVLASSNTAFESLVSKKEKKIIGF